MQESPDAASSPENETETQHEESGYDENLEYEPFSEELDSESEPPQQDAQPSTDHQNHVEELQIRLAQTQDQMIRALAEAENARKRAQKDREEASKFAISKFSKDLLSVADNLRRALEAIPEDLREQHEQIKGLTDGIEATERELLRCFEKNGIEKIIPLDSPFDPNFHEVMFEAPVPEKQGGTIIQVIEPGYTLNGRILRPARVGIAKAEDGQPTPPQTGGRIDTEA